MRPVLVALVALMALPILAGASEPSVVHRDWTPGHAWVGAALAVDGVNAARLPFEVDACHRRILVDLLYAPDEVVLAQEGVGEVALLFTFRLELRSGSAVLATRDVREPGYGHSLGTVAREGDYEVRVVLTQGADVPWEARVRGWEVPEEAACLPRVVVNEVEANPAGVDAGAEWLEIHNAADKPVDLSGWNLTATHGVPQTLFLPEGTVLAAGGFLRVDFPDGQFLDNLEEVVVLTDLFGIVRDETPTLSDAENDGSSWQRAPDGADAWTFAPATPGQANAS